MNKRQILVIASTLAIILAVCLIAVFIINKSDNATREISGPTKEQKDQESTQNAETKKEVIEKPDQAREPADTTNHINKDIELTAKQEDDGTVTVFTKLFGYSAGSCDLTISNDDNDYKDSATIIYQPEFSSCAGFSVPEQSLSNGSWLIKLTVNSNNRATEKQISFDVK